MDKLREPIQAKESKRKPKNLLQWEVGIFSNLINDTMNPKNQLDHEEVETRWQESWERNKTFSINLKTAKNPFYNLMMFPYPSAEWLHVWNFYAFTWSDIFGRYKKMNGFDVFEPMGFDAFWIHSENFAMKKNIHPKTLIENNLKTFKDVQLKKLWALFDWDFEVNTTTPEYYKWNQWIFTKMFELWLAYKKTSRVNWCPDCMTVISDEQVIDWMCERHWETEVEKRELDQWFFKITDFAKELYEGLDNIDWSDKTKITQRNWINQKKWTVAKFMIKDSNDCIEVFTTRIDTIHWVTFLAIAPDSQLAKQLLPQNQIEELEKMVQEQSANREIKEKKWLLTSIKVIHPFTGKEIPVYVANYVLSEYWTWAVMWVPAHDDRDMEFSNKYNIDSVNVYNEDWKLINSWAYNWLTKKPAIDKINKELANKKLGWPDVRYKLRDWCISRQRYWWAPIPMVYCDKCWVVPEKEENLPVKLPDVENWKPKWDWYSPLANIPEFYKTKCPCCNWDAKRETDVMDNFVDSSYYFFRYLDPKNSERLFDPELAKKWTPIDMYIWWNEHAVLHLLYTRFITKVFKKMWLIDFDEPFKKFFAHWLIIKDWTKMSKSKWNVVNPDEYIKKYWSDALRMYLMFIWPLDSGWDFSDTWIAWINKYIKRVYSLISSREISEDDSLTDEVTKNQTIKTVTNSYESFKYNVGIARCMEYYNYLQKKPEITRQECETILKLLAPIAPHFTEELWVNKLWNKWSIHLSAWPVQDKSVNLIGKNIDMPVQINWKLKWTINVARNISEEDLLKIVESDNKLSKSVTGKKIKKTIFVPWKIINIILTD